MGKQTPRYELYVLLLILLAGSFLRLYRLDTIPAGLSTDESTAGINSESVLDGNLLLFFPPFDEPVYVYASALGIALFGPTLLGLHIAAAIFGILAIFATYLLARELYSKEVGLAASAGLAISLWPVLTSRLGFRAISLPCLELFAFFSLWRALRTKKVRYFALAGFLLALVLYTYPSSRILPVFVILFFAGTIAIRKWGLYNPSGLVVYGAAFLMTLVPFGVYFAAHPDNFTGRFEEAATVTPGSTVASSGAIESLTRTLGMFAFAGDQQWKYNLAGQPVFNPLWALLFAAGLVLALWRGRRPEYFFLLLWFTFGLLPGILTSEAPHNLRTIDSQPAAYFFPALAISAAFSYSKVRARRIQELTAVAVLLFFAGSAVITFQDYFVRWANDSHVTALFYPDIAGAMRLLKAFKPSDQVYMSVRAPDLIAPMRNYFAWRQSIPLPQLFDAGQGIVLDRNNRRSIYILPMSAPASQGVDQILLQGALIREEKSDIGQILYRAYAIENVSLPTPGTRLVGRFGNLTELTGYDLSGPFQVGKPLTVTLYSTPIEQAVQEGEYKFFVHLVDSTGYLWSQAEGIGGDPAQWTQSEIVLTSLSLLVPADAPPKNYSIEVGLYSFQRGRLPVLDSENHVTGTTMATNPFRIAGGIGASNVENLASHKLPDRPIGDQLAIAGYDAEPSVDPGSTFRLTLYWESLTASKHDDMVQLSLIDQSGVTAAQVTSDLIDDSDPAEIWRSNDLVRNSYLLPVPQQLVAGTYRLVLELLDRSSARKLGTAIELSDVQVSNVSHRMTVPTIKNPLYARLGDSIEFIGYDIAPSVNTGSSLDITLYWRDRQTTSVSYTVFVHLIDKNNGVIAQRDRPPLNGARLTTSWIPGEFLVDRFRIPIPQDLQPDRYTLEIGMYDPDTLVRLPVFGSTGERMDADRLSIGNVNVVKP